MEHKIIVYGKCGGFATMATFLGNQWWVTNTDEKLEPLYDKSPYTEHDYRYLCEAGEMVQMRDLAGMMGAAMEMSEGNIKEVLTNRLRDLNMMGTKFISSPQHLILSLRVTSNFGTGREGNFSLTGRDTERDVPLFRIDDFDDAKEALRLAKAYVDFFLKHGVRVCATLHATEDVLEQLTGEIQNMKVVIEGL